MLNDVIKFFEPYNEIIFMFFFSIGLLALMVNVLCGRKED